MDNARGLSVGFRYSNAKTWEIVARHMEGLNGVLRPLGFGRLPIRSALWAPLSPRPSGSACAGFGGLIGTMNTITMQMYCAVDTIACNLCGMKRSLKAI